MGPGSGGALATKGPGYSPVNKFGENSDIDTGSVPETIWTQGGVFPFLDAGIEMDLVSTSAADASAGTGARTVTMTRYDDSNNEIIADFTLTGLTRVEIPGLVKLGSRIEALTTGTGNTNAGRIVLVDRASGLVIYQAVEIGEGQTLSTPQMCPAGKKGLIRFLYATYARVSNRNGAQLKLRLRKTDGTILTKYPADISTDYPRDEKAYAVGGIGMAAGEIAYWECVDVTANDTPIQAGFDIEFEDA